MIFLNDFHQLSISIVVSLIGIIYILFPVFSNKISAVNNHNKPCGSITSDIDVNDFDSFDSMIKVYLISCYKRHQSFYIRGIIDHKKWKQKQIELITSYVYYSLK